MFPDGGRRPTPAAKCRVWGCQSCRAALLREGLNSRARWWRPRPPPIAQLRRKPVVQGVGRVGCQAVTVTRGVSAAFTLYFPGGGVLFAAREVSMVRVKRPETSSVGEGPPCRTSCSKHPVRARGNWSRRTSNGRSAGSPRPRRSGFPRGFSEGTARYGMLIDHLQPAVVNGFLYTRLAMFGDDRPGGTATPEEMQTRIMTSAAAFEQKRWRADLAEWDEVDRPAAIAEHRALQAVDPTALSDEELAEHLARCGDHVEEMIDLHHKYSATAVVTAGDFLAGARGMDRCLRRRAHGDPARDLADLERIRRGRAGRTGRRRSGSATPPT